MYKRREHGGFSQSQSHIECIYTGNFEAKSFLWTVHLAKFFVNKLPRMNIYIRMMIKTLKVVGKFKFMLSQTFLILSIKHLERIRMSQNEVSKMYITKDLRSSPSAKGVLPASTRSGSLLWEDSVELVCVAALSMVTVGTSSVSVVVDSLVLVVVCSSSLMPGSLLALLSLEE